MLVSSYQMFMVETRPGEFHAALPGGGLLRSEAQAFCGEITG